MMKSGRTLQWATEQTSATSGTDAVCAVVEALDFVLPVTEENLLMKNEFWCFQCSLRK